MKLNVKERLMLLGILPKESNFVTLKIVKELQSELGFSEDEIKLYEFKNQSIDGQTITTWNPLKNEDKEIKIGEKATDIIVEELKKIDDSKKLNMDQFALYEKFVK